MNGRNELTERKLLPGDSRKVFGGRESPTAQMWNGSTNREAPAPASQRGPEGELCPWGWGIAAGQWAGKEAFGGKGAARSLHHGGLGGQRWGSPAVGGVQVRVLLMILEAVGGRSSDVLE